MKAVSFPCGRYFIAVTADSIVDLQATGHDMDILEEDIVGHLLTTDLPETGRDDLAVDSAVGRRVKRISGSRSVLSRIIFDLK